jgi:filamentous hemagglutinin
VEQLNSDPKLSGKIDWVKVEEAHKNWNHSQQGLTPEGAAIVILVMNFVSFGAAAGAGAAAGDAAAVAAGQGIVVEGATFAAGSAVGAVVGGAVQAGIMALASQAAVALINNQGDIGGALNDLGSSASVKNLLTAVVTGGVLGGLNLNPTGLPTVGGGTQQFMTQLGQNLTAGAARAVIGTAINGGSFEENLKQGLKNALLDTVAAQTANAIGTLTAIGTLDDFTNKIAHAIAGCAVGAGKADNSSGCGAGAIGAVIGEISGNAYGRDEFGNLRPGAVEMAQMFAGIAGALAGLDAAEINIAAAAGANAAANNALSLRGSAKLMSDLRACSSGAGGSCDIAQLREEMARDADKQAQRIDSACGSGGDLSQCMALANSANLSLTNLIVAYEYADTADKKTLVGDLLGRQIEDMTRLYNTLGTQQETASVRELVGAAITGSLQAAGVVGMSIGGKKPGEYTPPITTQAPLGLGSTGRSTPANLQEQLALQQAMSNPAAGTVLRIPLRDARWPAADGWEKMSQTINGTQIHYVRNSISGAVDDFKFK